MCVCVCVCVVVFFVLFFCFFKGGGGGLFVGLRTWMYAPVSWLKVHFRRKQVNLLSGHRRSRTAPPNPVTQFFHIATSCVSGLERACSVSSFWFPSSRCVSVVMGSPSVGRGGRRDGLDLCRRQANLLLRLSVQAGLLQRERIDLKVTAQLSHH